MTEQKISTMMAYYVKKYGEPTDGNDAIAKLITIYQDLFNQVPSSDIQEGIAEYYRVITSRELPAYVWILEALHVTSKKEGGKRTFPYAVGMIRAWLKYGFGHIPNQEEDELSDYFEQLAGYEVTHQSRKVLQNLMGKYGCIKLTMLMNDIRNDMDMSMILMLKLKQMADEQFSVKQGEIEQSYQRSVNL